MTDRRPLRARRARNGFTILEVLVVVAILIALVAVVGATLSNVLALEQRRLARDLALTYERLHDEAILRNVTFRLTYHLDEGFYEVEVGDPDTLIFDDPEARQEAEEEQKEKMDRFSDEERAAAEQSEVRFETVTTFEKRRIDLPSGTAFGGVFTPQYEDIVRPSGATDAEDFVVVHSYLFPSGYSEPTVVQIVEIDDPEEGFTVVVEPLSGRVRLLGEVVDQHDAFDDSPPSPPDLP